MERGILRGMQMDVKEHGRPGPATADFAALDNFVLVQLASATT